MKKFVYATRNINTEKWLVQENDVWILDEKYWDMHHVFFLNIWDSVLLEDSDFSSFDVDTTWDEYEKKICNVCQKLIITTHFQKNQNGKNNRTVRRPSCNDCRKIIDGTSIPSSIKREWYSKRPHKEPFECPVCQKRTIAWVTSKIVLDHNHDTWEVRWWICDSCNTGLWRFKDDIDLMSKAIDYLSNY